MAYIRLADLAPLQLCFLLIHATLAIDIMPRALGYEIKTTWDGKPVDHSPIIISLESDPAGVAVVVKGPFFNDPGNPGGTPGEPFWELWNYEVVEAFFANDKQEYIEVELCPWGEQIVLLLDSPGNAFKHSLPLDFKVIQRSESTGVWEGRAIIPADYFPPSVKTFNLYAIHGSDTERVYEALSPFPEGQFTEPNFHHLEYFQPIDFSSLLPSNANAEYSSVWTQRRLQAPPEPYTATIGKAWDSNTTVDNPTNITLTATAEGLQIELEGKLYMNPQPDTAKDQPCYELRQFDEVEIVFASATEDNAVVGIAIGPFGHYLVSLVNNGSIVERGLPLTVNATVDDSMDNWKTTFIIPTSYFPPNVTTWNAFAFHEEEGHRIAEAFFKPPREKSSWPNVYDTKMYTKFKGDFELFVNTSVMSSEWSTALDTKAFDATARNQWDGTPASHQGYILNVISVDENQIKLEVDGPYNQTATVSSSNSDFEASDVTEVFFSNEMKNYMMLYFYPKSKEYKVIFYREKRIIVGSGYNVEDIEVQPNSNRYHAEIFLPISYLPANTNHYNIAGVWHNGTAKEYDCLYPHPNAAIGIQDLHTLAFFEKIPDDVLAKVLPPSSNSEYSEEWKKALGL